MPDNVKEVEFNQYRKECVDDAVRILENVLAKAKSGEVTSVAIAMTVAGKCFGTQFSKTDDISSLLGGAAHLVYRINKDLEE